MGFSIGSRAPSFSSFQAVSRQCGVSPGTGEGKGGPGGGTHVGPEHHDCFGDRFGSGFHFGGASLATVAAGPTRWYSDSFGC